MHLKCAWNVLKCDIGKGVITLFDVLHRLLRFNLHHLSQCWGGLHPDSRRDVDSRLLSLHRPESGHWTESRHKPWCDWTLGWQNHAPHESADRWRRSHLVKPHCAHTYHTDLLTKTKQKQHTYLLWICRNPHLFTYVLGAPRFVGSKPTISLNQIWSSPVGGFPRPTNREHTKQDTDIKRPLRSFKSKMVYILCGLGPHVLCCMHIYLTIAKKKWIDFSYVANLIILS